MIKKYILFSVTLFITFFSASQVTLTQSNDPTTINTLGDACDDPLNGFYNDNHFYRVYNLNNKGISGAFNISAVQYGQGSANNGKEIKLIIYTATSEDLTTATLTKIGEVTHISSSADNMQLVTVPISLSIPAGSNIAFELFAADAGTNTNQNFIPGFNGSGEMDDTYIKAPECGVTNIVTWTSIGFPAQKHVMNVVGNQVLGVDDFNVSKVSIKPNPASDFITIELNASNSLKSANLYSVTGQLVYKGGQSKHLDISQLKSGVYILELNTELGKVNRKIIKR